MGMVRHWIAGEEEGNREKERWARQLGIPLVAVGAIQAARPEDKPLLDVVMCIRERMTIEQAGDRLAPNGERALKSLDELTRRFSDHPEWLRESVSIAEECSFSLDELRYSFPLDMVSPEETPMSFLRKRVEEGIIQRYGAMPPESVQLQLEHELDLIERMNFAGYFLTVWDIVRFARSRGILCQGRGSAANSAVCFVLGITSIDPVRLNLLFERFISLERGEPPDIDVDFEHERREEVMQYVYEHMAVPMRPWCAK